MNLGDMKAVIDSAKARGMGPLHRLVRKRLPDATDDEVWEAAEVAVEIIESVPIFLERAEQEARERDLVMVVQPLLDHAQGYFLQPFDLLPEMTHGLAGLLDDAYLILRVLQNLDRGPERFLDWDLDYPITFVGGLLGRELASKLDAISLGAMRDLDADLARVWDTVPEA